MGETYGVPVEEIQEGIKHGVRKVNIDTDLRMASTGAIRKYLHDNPSNFDPRKYLKAATEGMKEICKARYEAFGTAGNASKIKPITLEDMYKRYDVRRAGSARQLSRCRRLKKAARAAFFWCTARGYAGDSRLQVTGGRIFANRCRYSPFRYRISSAP